MKPAPRPTLLVRVKRGLMLAVGLPVAVGLILVVVGFQVLGEGGKQAAFRGFSWIGRTAWEDVVWGGNRARTVAQPRRHASTRRGEAASETRGSFYEDNVALPRAAAVPMKPVVPSPLHMTFEVRRVRVPRKGQQDPLFRGLHLLTIPELRYDDKRLGYNDDNHWGDAQYNNDPIMSTTLGFIVKVTLVGDKPIRAALGLVNIRDRAGRMISEDNSWQFPTGYNLNLRKNQKRVLDSKTAFYSEFSFQRYEDPKVLSFDEPEFRRLLDTQVNDLRFELTPYFVAYTDGTTQGDAKAALYLGHDGYEAHVTSLPWYISLQYPDQYPNVDETTPLHYKMFPEIKRERFGRRYYESKEAFRRESMEFWTKLRAL